MAAGNFFGGEFFGGGFFGALTTGKTGTGGIDPDEVRRRIVKPTGLLHLPKEKGRTLVEDRIDESRDIQAEVAAKLAREFGEETAAIQIAMPVAQMSLAEVEREIGVLLRKKLRTEEDEIVLLLLIVAAAA